MKTSSFSYKESISLYSSLVWSYKERVNIITYVLMYLFPDRRGKDKNFRREWRQVTFPYFGMILRSEVLLLYFIVLW
jgi:hypothetical protein